MKFFATSLLAVFLLIATASAKPAEQIRKKISAEIRQGIDKAAPHTFVRYSPEGPAHFKVVKTIENLQKEEFKKASIQAKVNLHKKNQRLREERLQKAKAATFTKLQKEELHKKEATIVSKRVQVADSKNVARRSFAQQRKELQLAKMQKQRHVRGLGHLEARKH